MCDHKYKKLGYLMVYPGEEFCPSGLDNPEKHVRGAYLGWMAAIDTIIVYQCRDCGRVKLSNGVLETIGRQEELQ